VVLREQVKAQPERGQRGAELMGYVGHHRAVTMYQRFKAAGHGVEVGGQPADLLQDAARGLFVDLGKGLRAEQLLPVQHLEQVELDVTKVALVVPHRGLPGSGGKIY